MQETVIYIVVTKAANKHSNKQEGNKDFSYSKKEIRTLDQDIKVRKWAKISKPSTHCKRKKQRPVKDTPMTGNKL